MKIKELQDLRLKDLKELEKLVLVKKLELTRSRAARKSGKEKNLKKGKNLGRDISQILTLIREKEIMEIESSEKP